MRSALQHLLDAREASSIITDRVALDSQVRFEADSMYRDSLVLQLHVLDEAVNRAAQVCPGLRTALPSVAQIVGLRNRIAHGYRELDNDQLWLAMTVSVPDLMPILDELCERSDTAIDERFGG